jgi:hypothetical protein
MTKKIKLACVFPNVGQVITKTFENSRVDPANNSTVYFKDNDWEIKAKTNTLSNGLDNKFYVIHEFDLDSAKIYNPKRKKVDLEEFISGIKECVGNAFTGQDVKIVSTDETKKELKALVDSGVLNLYNVVSSKIEEDTQVDLNPFADLVIEDEEVDGIKDLEKKIKESVKANG